MSTKQNKCWTKPTLYLSLLLFTSLLLSANCMAEICGTSMSTRLIAGQNIEVGSVSISNDEANVYVIYQTDGYYAITETHLDVATSPDLLKQTRQGNAIPGKFAYATEHDPGVYEVTHTIDITQWPAGTQLYFAAHAVVTSSESSETAWGEGEDFPGRNWAMYIGYEIQLCEDPPLNPGIIEFQDPEISTPENNPMVLITLIRTDGSDGVVSVEVNYVDITATANEDYFPLGYPPIVFNDGETTQQIRAFPLDDYQVEDDEQFQLQLSNPVGASLGPQDTTTITIIDDDTGPVH